MNGIRIKKLQAEDALLLSKVALKAYSDHYLHLWYDGGIWYMEKYFTVERLEEELKIANSLFFLAFFNDSPVGFLKLNIDAPLEGQEGKNALELERIYLNKEAEGKGIGRELVKLTVGIAQELDKDLIWLKAMDTSEGPIAFYKNMGFELTGTFCLKHELMKEELRGMVIMTKRLG